MKNLVLLCLLAIMALTASAETKYDFDISYFDVAPLYSRQSEADQYKIGKIYTSEVWIDADSLSYDIRYCKYELCNDEKWTKVLITYDDDLEDKEVKLSVYVPTTYVRYEIPITRSSDGLSAYELLEDKELDDYYGNDIVIPKNEVVIVERIYHDKALCKYQNNYYGFITPNNIVPTDKEYEVPFYYSSWWKSIWDTDNLLWLAVIGVIALAVLCDRYYRRKLLSEGKWCRPLDITAGLLFAVAVVGAVFAYSQSPGGSIFKDIVDLLDLLPNIESDFWYNVVLCAYTLLLFVVWFLIERFLVNFGSNGLVHTTFTLFIACVVLCLMGESFRTDLWAFLGVPAIGFSAFIGWSMVIGYFNFNRCPFCHNMRNIGNEGTDDLGRSVEHSIEHETVHPDSDTRDEYTYDVYKTKQNYNHHQYCSKCGGRWDVKTSYTVDTDKRVKSWERWKKRYE